MVSQLHLVIQWGRFNPFSLGSNARLNHVKPMGSPNSSMISHTSARNDQMHKKFIYDIWYMIYDIWYMIYDIWHMTYDIWCMIYDIWYMIYDVWCMIYDIWYMIYDIWYMIYDIWYMIYDIWYMIYDIWYMIYDIWYMIYDIWYIYIYVHVLSTNQFMANLGYPTPKKDSFKAA